MISIITATCGYCDNAMLMVRRSPAKVDLGNDHAITCGTCGKRCVAAVIMHESINWHGESDRYEWSQYLNDFGTAWFDLAANEPRRPYLTLEDFYRADGRRRPSSEADYGCHWKLDGWNDAWRVSYVQSTGEVYAVYQGQPTSMQKDSIGPVFVLGTIPADPIAEGDRKSVYYHTLDRILDGWPEHCGKPDGLKWLSARLSAEYPAPA